MNHDLSVFRSITIDAGPEAIWDAMTNPEKIKIYLFGTECTCDWEEGSPITFEGEYEGKKYKDKGIIKISEVDEVLSYTYWSGFSGLKDHPDNYSLVTYQIENIGFKNILELTQQGFASESNQEHAYESWGLVLKQIKDIAEEK